jgi:hypothetical protein
MTLKEQFECIDYNEMGIDVQNCVKITEDFAIGFAEWINSNAAHDASGYYAVIGHTSYHTLPKLLEIYKKEKGL